MPGLGPPYPVVLVHGFFGFDELGGIDSASYFYGVVDRLAEDGELRCSRPRSIRSTTRPSAACSCSRGRADRRRHRPAKVNLVGHSQGGLDARVVASVRPELVATVTTIATPHHGTPIADIVLGAVPDPNAQAIADALAQLLGGGLWSELDSQQLGFVALAQLGQRRHRRVQRDVSGCGGCRRTARSPGAPRSLRAVQSAQSTTPRRG